jgi:hypothetical protein
MNIMVVKSHGLLADDHRGRLRLGLGLSSVIADNLRGRSRLSRHFERVILHDPRLAPPLHALHDFPSRFVTLDAGNLRQALLAFGSIPMIMQGARDLPGAGVGTYRDGGLLDYHLDLPYSGEDIVLYPHFTDRVIPGWFDKGLPWRRSPPSDYGTSCCWHLPGITWPACPTANCRIATTSNASWAMTRAGKKILAHGHGGKSAPR